MGICEVHSQTVTLKYKSTLCSKSTIFSISISILTYLLPFLIAYRSHGFWIKIAEYREQPNVHFKHDYLLFMETDQPDKPILCSTFPYSKEFDRCSVIKVNKKFFCETKNWLMDKSGRICQADLNSREEDNNQDGKFDELIFEAELDVPEDVGVYSIQLVLVFDYILQEYRAWVPLLASSSSLTSRITSVSNFEYLQKQCLLQMESLGMIQYSSGMPGNRFDFIGDLRLVQKQLLTTRVRDVRFNQPNFSLDEDSASDLNLNSIIKNYSKRNVSTRLENSYQMWTAGVLLEEPFIIKVNIHYPEETIKYKPSFWQVLKWAWMQYFCILFIFFNIFNWVKSYVFRNHLIPVLKEVPWGKKFF